jgi:peptidoglycan/LPS O-acetylase OafA/YrhL
MVNDRAIYTFLLGICFMPFMLPNKAFLPMTNILSAQFWVAPARLTYGVYLCHPMFMLFFMHNSERGAWGCQVDTFFMFIAYLTFAFLFALIITLTVELPCQRIYEEFFGKVKITAKID